MDYKGPEPEGLCIKFKKILPCSINQLVNQNYNQLYLTKRIYKAGNYN